MYALRPRGETGFIRTGSDGQFQGTAVLEDADLFETTEDVFVAIAERGVWLEHSGRFHWIADKGGFDLEIVEIEDGTPTEVLV